MKIPRWLKLVSIWMLGILIVIISLYALLFAWVSFSAKREWAQVKKELEARGEKLSLSQMIPESIPDELNFYYAPLFRDMVESPRDKKIRVNDLVPKPANGKKFVVFACNRSSDGLTDLENNAAYLRTNENRNLTAAEVILDAFNAKDALWEELYQAAERPGARFPLDYSQNFAILMPHISAVQKISQMLSLRSVAYMETGKSQGAKRDIFLILRLSDAMAGEPLLISQLVRIACTALATARIQEGIQRHIWTTEQLNDFENRLASEDMMAGLSLALRGDRGVFNDFSAQLLRGSGEGWEILPQILTSYTITSKPTSPHPFWVHFIPWSWFYWNMALNSSEIQKQLDIVDNIRRSGLNKSNLPVFSLSGFERMKYLLVTLVGTGLKSAEIRAIQVQAWVDMARIACALERYKMAMGAYPASLNQLVPQYIQKLPKDIANAQPYHYRMESNHFTLWSVGFDGADDHAVQSEKEHPESGDWVWGNF